VSAGERRPDWRGEATTFVDEHGVERVVIAVDHYTGAEGYYGGVSPAEFERNGFSCGARYYFGEAVELLGVERRPCADCAEPTTGCVVFAPSGAERVVCEACMSKGYDRDGHAVEVSP